MDGAIVALISVGTAVVLAVGAAYRAIRDNIDSTKTDLGQKIDTKYDTINASIQKQAEQIGELNGKVASYNSIRSQCMARFEAIEDNVTILHASRRKRRKEI